MDFDEIEYKQVYDPNSSLSSRWVCLRSRPHGRIDLIMDVASGKAPMTSQPATEQFYKAYDINYYTMPQADAATWLNKQFGTNIAAPAASAGSGTSRRRTSRRRLRFCI